MKWASCCKMQMCLKYKKRKFQYSHQQQNWKKHNKKQVQWERYITIQMVWSFQWYRDDLLFSFRPANISSEHFVLRCILPDDLSESSSLSLTHSAAQQNSKSCLLMCIKIAVSLVTSVLVLDTVCNILWYTGWMWQRVETFCVFKDLFACFFPILPIGQIPVFLFLCRVYICLHPCPCTFSQVHLLCTAYSSFTSHSPNTYMYGWLEAPNLYACVSECVWSTGGLSEVYSCL